MPYWSHSALRLAAREELKLCSVHQGWHWRVNYTCQWPHCWPCLRSDGKECIVYLWHSYEVISVGSIKAYGLNRGASIMHAYYGTGWEWVVSFLPPATTLHREEETLVPRLSDPCRQSVYFGEEKVSSFCWELPHSSVVFHYLAQSLYQVHFINFPELMFSVRNLAGRVQPNYQRKADMKNSVCP